jgi:hypothetical protein
MQDSHWSFDRDTGNLRYIGGDHADSAPSYATVIECHRWLQDLADDAYATGDDELDITYINPSSRSFDNLIYFLGDVNIDDASAEHLYDGTIIQKDGTERYDGIVNFGNSNVQIQIIQNGAVLSDDWWNYDGGGLNADAAQGISHRFLIKTRDNDVDIDGRRILGTCRRFGYSYSEFLINGTALGNNVLALSDADDINNDTDAGTVSGWTGITNTEGLRAIDVNQDGTTEQYYSEWNTNQPTRSINDFYERMKWLTRDGSASTINGLNGELFRGITHSFEYDGETGGAPSTNDEYAWGTAIAYSGESGGPFSVGEAVWQIDSTVPGWTGRILAIDDDGDTGTLIVDVRTGTVTDTDTFEGQTSSATATVNGTPTAVTGGGTFRFFAVDDQGTTGYLYGAVIKGTAPSNNTRMYDDADVGKYLDVNDTSAFPITARAISTPFCGISTGTAIIGAYGFGVEAADLSNTDSVTALDGDPYAPPVLTTNTVGGLATNQDYVLVAPWDGSSLDAEDNPAIDKDQLSLSVALTTDDITQVEVTESIPADTPTTGHIRVTDNNGFERRLYYDSWENSSINYFSIGSSQSDGQEDFNSVNANVGNDVYITYLDELITSGTTLSYQGTYSTDRDLVVIVRDGGGTPIKEFISAWTFKSTNQTINAQRISDT